MKQKKGKPEREVEETILHPDYRAGSQTETAGTKKFKKNDGASQQEVKDKMNLLH